jgi:hypothetical protein
MKNSEVDQMKKQINDGKENDTTPPRVEPQPFTTNKSKILEVIKSFSSHQDINRVYIESGLDRYKLFDFLFTELHK